MAETTNYQCPNCNGKLSFDSSVGKLRCEFCGSAFTPEEVERLFAAKQEKADAAAAHDRREQFATTDDAGTSADAMRVDAKAAAREAYDRALAEGKTLDEARKAAEAAMNAALGSVEEAHGATTAAAAAAIAGGAHAKPSMSAAAASTSAATHVEHKVPLTGDPIQDYIAQSKWTDADISNMQAYNCPSCGAQLMVDQVTAVTSCPYCGNNTVVPGQLSDVLKPDYVIPFKLDRDAAVAALNRYYGGKPLLPSNFTANNHIQEVQGIYVPFWLYSGTGQTDATFNGRNLRTWSDSEYNYTEIDHFRLHRAGNMKFARVPVDGSTKMPDAHMDAIEPYDYSELVPFSVAYLPGYLTDRYDLDVAQCDARARNRVENTCHDVIGDTAGGYMETDLARISSDVTWTDISYALLPVWMLHTKWSGQDYLFAMNGQTGKLIGDLPIDQGKVVKRFIMMFLPIMIVVAAIIFFVFGFGL